MNKKITAYCYSKFDKINGSAVGFIIRNGVDRVFTLPVESKSQEFVELESIRLMLDNIPENTAVELFMHPGKATKAITSNAVEKHLLEIFKKKCLRIYWLRKEEQDAQIEKIKRLI